MTLDRRDFDEWWAREEARNTAGPIGADYKHWAEAGFFAAQALLRNHVRHQQQRERARDAQRPARLLMRDMLKAADK